MLPDQVDYDEKYLLSLIFASFGWEITPEFLQKYLTDPWVYNLTNALIQTYQIAHLESNEN